MELQTGAVVDRYSVEGLLGQGGMAVVYRVRHERLGSLHALKVLLLPAKAIRERLLLEGRVQAQLRHPNVISVTDVIEVDGAPGLVMEYVAGPSLDDLLRQVHLSVDQADLLGRGVLEGVAGAHEAGLVHRDLKPGNILLEIGKAGLTPKITDFGLAKLMEADGTGGNMTRSGLAMGTPCYMAPEQIRNAKGVDERADVFSLGCVLYELITGQRAFDGADTFEIFSAVTSGTYTPVKAVRPDAPERMIHAIAQALETDRDKRVASVEALLKLWIDGVPAPVTSEVYQPAFLERAVELGSAGELPSSQMPASGGTVSATMDWSLGNEPKSAASIVDQEPKENPVVVPVLAETPVAPVSMAPSKASVGMAMFGGVSLLLGLGLMVVVVFGVGYVMMGQEDVSGVAVVPVEVAAQPIDEPEVEAVPEAIVDVPVVADPVPKTPIATAPTPGAVAPVPKETAVQPAPDTPDVEDPVPDAGEDLLGEEADPETDLEGVPEAGLDENPDEDALIVEEPIEAPVVMGIFAVSVRLHPMTSGAETRTPVFLVQGQERYPPGEVPVGDYFIEGQFTRKGSPTRAGKLTITEGKTSKIICYTATRECRPN